MIKLILGKIIMAKPTIAKLEMVKLTMNIKYGETNHE